MIAIDEGHLECWRTSRYVVVRGALDRQEQRQVSEWVSELAAWPETPGRWMKYFEGESRQLCRVENFVPYHAGLRSLLARPDLGAVLARLLGEPAVLFKEKINYKLPGGQGFAAHQDAPAFTSFGQPYHITLMLAADATTIENGCLEMVDGHAERCTLPQAPDGTLHPDVVSRLRWRPLATEAADLVLFDSYVPHRSGPNLTEAPRRALYVTYNGISAGDRRADYFEQKRRSFPPECERESGASLSQGSAMFNLGNPIR